LQQNTIPPSRKRPERRAAAEKIGLDPIFVSFLHRPLEKGKNDDRSTAARAAHIRSRSFPRSRWGPTGQFP